MKIRESGKAVCTWYKTKTLSIMTRLLLSFRNAIRTIFCDVPALCDAPDAGDVPVLCAALVGWDRNRHGVLCVGDAPVPYGVQDAGAFPGRPGFPGLDCQNLAMGFDCCLP